MLRLNEFTNWPLRLITWKWDFSTFNFVIHTISKFCPHSHSRLVPWSLFSISIVIAKSLKTPLRKVAQYHSPRLFFHKNIDFNHSFPISLFGMKSEKGTYAVKRSQHFSYNMNWQNTRSQIMLLLSAFFEGAAGTFGLASVAHPFIKLLPLISVCCRCLFH